MTPASRKTAYCSNAYRAPLQGGKGKRGIIAGEFDLPAQKVPESAGKSCEVDPALFRRMARTLIEKTDGEHARLPRRDPLEAITSLTVSR
jgi:hypothetical protein